MAGTQLCWGAAGWELAMFERFTSRARRVVVLAQEEARMLNHNYIGTEHILLGVIHEGEGVAAKALESLGVSLEAVRQQVEEIIGQGQQAPSGHIPFTPRAKKVLELSLREALQLGHNSIGTGHILLGLLREGEGVGTQVLVRLGNDLNLVRRRVISLSPGQEGEGDQPATAHAVRPQQVGRGEIRDSLSAIADRLTAIEKHLGISRPDDAAPAEGAAGFGSTADEASEPGEAGCASGEDASGGEHAEG
jgi:ATP-dependent Clp protease ATP-binding subunit ClpC